MGGSPFVINDGLLSACAHCALSSLLQFLTLGHSVERGGSDALSGAFVSRLVQPLQIERAEMLVLAQFDVAFASEFQRCAEA